jgi:uncharacterized protein YjbJ (UPF0337 family)
MNWDIIVGKWEEMKADVKVRWAKLTDDDLMYVNGKRDKLIAKLRERYGYAKDKADSEVDLWLSSLDRPGVNP